MADETPESMDTLKKEAARAILQAIPDMTHDGKATLNLAMAYTVLNRGKLPGETPSS